MILFVAVAFAGPEHVERVHARKEARTIELLQRSTSRPDVPEQAVARYLDRWGHVDVRAVDRIEAWGAWMQPAEAPVAVPTEPAVEPAPEVPADAPLAIPETPK